MQQSQSSNFRYPLALHQNGEFENAKTAYYELLQHEPDNHAVINALACVYQGLGKNNKALELYRKAASFSQNTTLYKFNIATTLMNLDHDDEALLEWNKYISLVAQNAGAYRNRAWIYWHKKSMLEKARDDYQLALKYQADNILTYCDLGQLLIQLNELQEADDTFKKATALANQQNNQENHKLLATTFMNLARTDDAISQWNKYLSHVPYSDECYSYRALLLWEKGEIEQAQNDYQLAIKYAPDTMENYCKLSELLWLHDKHGDMEEVLEQAWILASKKNIGPLYKQLAMTADKLNLIERALACLQKCIESEIEDEDLINRCYKQMMYLHLRNNDNEKAKENCKVWAQHHSQNPIPNYFLNILEKNQPDRAPASYVAHEFDNFANTFDKTLLNLSYNAPQIIAENVTPWLADKSKNNIVLDLGSGTGLSGKAVAHFSKYLEGVDLSQKMLDKSQSLKIYDQLTAVDFIDYLDGIEERYDLIIAADSFVYLGALDDVIARASKALKSGGILSFTSELLEHDKSPWKVQTHGRFSHNKDYLNKLLTTHHLDICVNDERSYRKDKNNPIKSLIVVAMKK